MIAMIIKKALEHITARVPDYVKKVVELETKSRGLDSQGDFISLAVIHMAESAEAKALLQSVFDGDPMNRAILQAINVPAAEHAAYVLHDKPSAKPAAKPGKSAAVASLKSKLAQMDAVTK